MAIREMRFGYDGDSGLGDRLVDLVLAGVKTATSSLAVEYLTGEPLPRPGERLQLVDSAGTVRGLVETTRVRIVPLDLVDDDVARDEGEGFADVAAWRAAHVRFWDAVAPLVRDDAGDPDWTLRVSEPVVWSGSGCCPSTSVASVADPARRARAGILHPARAQQRIDLQQHPPPPALAPFVDYLWSVTWHAPGGHVQEVIPRPAVQLVAERVDGVPVLRVNGVMRHRFERRLVGDDRAVAVAFRPAGLRPFVTTRVADLTDRVVAASALLGDDAGLAAHLLDPAVPVANGAAALATWLAARTPPADPTAAELGDLVERAETDRSLTRAEHLAGLAGVGLRTLQRQFAEYVGVGPKWVVQRCRLLDVAAAAHDDAPVDWAALAASLGYTDQSHLIRAFTALVGHPPATYRARA